MNLSLRARLTILTAALVAISTAALGTVIYFSAQSIQTERIDDALASEISEARVRSLQDNPRPPQDGIFVTVALGRLDRDGGITQLRPAGTREQPIPLPALTADQIADATREPITITSDGRNFRVAVISHGSGRATVVAAAPLDSYEQTMATLTTALIVSVLAVTFVGAVLAWLLVRRAFRPMRAMIASAAIIADGDRSHRLGTESPGTEIGDLSHSINTMIDSLAEAVAQAAESEDRLRTFISDASHEIRTPLTVIRGYSELLNSRGSELSDHDRAALARIESESKRLDRLVTQLLILEGRSASQKAPAAPVDVAAIAHEVFADFMALTPDRSVTLEIEPAVALANAEDVRHLLTNITQNITRHIPADAQVDVFIGTDGDSVVLLVDDAGPGIPPLQRASITDRTSRRHQSGEGAGFGLGMRIMVDAVAENGGTLELSDSPLGGLRILVTLPTSPTQTGT